MQRWIIGIIVLVVIGAIAYFFLGQGGEDGLAGGDAEPTTVPVDTLPAVTASDRVVAEAEVLPIRDVELRFELDGTIDRLLVVEGDRVEEGDLLAQLDTRDLNLDVEDKTAALAQSRADYELLLEGATDEEVAAAEAQVVNAEASIQRQQAEVARSEAEVARSSGDLQRTQGEVTESDIAAARATLEEKRAALADLEDGPDTVDVETARATLDQARFNLQETRDSLSAAKTNAQADVELAANELREAQNNFSQVYWEVREIERELNEVRQEIWQDLRDREEAAQRAVDNAEQQLEQATVAFENAQQAEVTGIQVAEANLRDAQARYDDVIAGAEESELAAARAAVADAEANLNQLLGQRRQGELASAAANVQSSQASVESSLADLRAAEAELARQEANLNDLTSDPRKPDVDDREARVLQAEVALRQAERNLEKASLLAPMDGTIVEVNLEEGERINTNELAVHMADFSEWKIETTDLTELGVVRIEVGDPVQITFDALPDVDLEGTVSAIQEIGKNRQGDIVYKVTVTPNEWHPRLRWGMTATVSIEPSEAEDSSASDEADDVSESDSTGDGE
jgi:HlyD family secretion protein